MVNKVFNNDAVVIYASSDDNYVPYLLVLLASIVENSSIKFKYDIIIFYFSMSEENRELIKLQGEGHDNISIRVIDISSELIVDENLLVTRTLTKEIWLKILGIYALKGYQKAIVIDCDVVCVSDIAELYYTDIGNDLMGVVKFLNMYIYKNSGILNRRVVMLKDHGIDIEDDYFNYGVALQNIEGFSHTYSLDFILKLISEQNYLVQDQDMLNILCKGKIKWIDSKWNTFPFTQREFENVIRMVPERERNYWIDGYENPSCIHYTIPVKPWLERRGAYSYASSFFWNSATKVKGLKFSYFTKRADKYTKNKMSLSEVIHKTYDDLCCDLKDKSLYVYGYGSQGKYIEKSCNYAISGFIDMDVNKYNNASRIPVGGYELIDQPQNAVILISNEKWEKIATILLDKGFKNIYSYFCLEKEDRTSWCPKQEDYYLISKCFGLFANEKSRRLFDTIVSKRCDRIIDRTIKYLDVFEGRQYFENDVLLLADDEIYVDIGSYKGETISSFIQCTRGSYRKIYGFEMNRANYEVLCDSVHTDKIEIMNLALSDYKGTGYYASHGYFSRLSKDGERIAVDRLDNILNDKVTLIKINVNNTREVIEGACNIIKKYKPKLAVLVSNKYSDLWEIPLLLQNINPEYNFYLKHHNTDDWDTVLYVI